MDRKDWKFCPCCGKSIDGVARPYDMQSYPWYPYQPSYPWYPYQPSYQWWGIYPPPYDPPYTVTITGSSLSVDQTNVDQSSEKLGSCIC